MMDGIDSAERLALNGGNPVRKEKIGYGRQWIDEDDMEAVVSVLKSDVLTCGPKIAQLEQELASYTGANYAVAVSNGTAALHCACMAARRQYGGRRGWERLVS